MESNGDKLQFILWSMHLGVLLFKWVAQGAFYFFANEEAREEGHPSSYT